MEYYFGARSVGRACESSINYRTALVRSERIVGSHHWRHGGHCGGIMGGEETIRV